MRYDHFSMVFAILSAAPVYAEDTVIQEEVPSQTVVNISPLEEEEMNVIPEAETGLLGAAALGLDAAALAAGWGSGPGGGPGYGGGNTLNNIHNNNIHENHNEENNHHSHIKKAKLLNRTKPQPHTSPSHPHPQLRTHRPSFMHFGGEHGGFHFEGFHPRGFHPHFGRR